MIDEVIAELFDESGIGASLVQRGLDRGRVEGRLDGRARFLTALITNRFGFAPEIPAIAHRLAGWSDSAAVHAVTHAQSLEQLARAEPPA